jgi:asparagine synthase (glutamine-hydrolysing)
MCGIAGIIGGPRETALERVGRMLDSLVHRGPDGAGTLQIGDATLGHRRLSIVDLESGAQPMRGANAEVALTFNGEIYGYRSLRRALEPYPFRTQSDTEVILAAYERHGAGLVRHLPGMFAFALYDSSRRTLICARDRFGEKPFYYARGPGGEFVFASELKAIVASGLVVPRVDYAALARVLKRFHLRPDQTIYANVHALPPASILVLEDDEPRVERYWSLPPPGPAIALDDAAARLRELLRAAVERQLVADVPVGVFLSGGLDSSTVASVASKLRPGISTFSFDFGGDHSESAFARDAADLFGTDHHVLAAPATGIGALLSRMCDVYDEPFLDSSAVPTYLLAQEAARHTKVVLTGDGGDELLGGYGWYQTLAMLERARSASSLEFFVLRLRHRLAGALGAADAAQVLERRVTAAGMARSYASIREAHERQLEFLNDREIAALGLPTDSHAAPRSRGSTAVEGTLDDAMRDDILDYMPGDILTKVDRASMAHGLELRAPFLDVEVAEFLIALPSELKAVPGESKRVLRAAFSSDWPASIRRRSKQGFGAPADEWLRHPDVAELAAAIVDDRFSQLYAYVDYEAAKRLGAGVPNGRRWALLCVGLWLARAVERRTAKSQP